MGITKTDFMRGMQCRKMLWLDKHKPSLKVIPPEVQQRSIITTIIVPLISCGRQNTDMTYMK